MRKLLLILCLFFTVFSSSAAELIHNDSATNQQDCFTNIFTSFDSWHKFIVEKIKRTAKTEQESAKRITGFEAVFNKTMFDTYKANLSCQTFTYLVDDVQVHGYLIKPKMNDKKLPVLIYNRGGNGNFGAVNFAHMMRTLFPIADQGFAIIGSQYRGTFTKANNLDEFGGKDVNDVLALLKLIPNIEDVDANKIGMLGISRGAMETHLAIKHTDKVKAIATVAGATDLLKELNFRPKMENVYSMRIPNYQQNKESELKARSVMSWVDTLSENIPILLIHGSADKRVSVENSIQFAEALNEHNIPNKLVIYEDDDHFLTNSLQQGQQEIVNWFKAYL